MSGSRHAALAAAVAIVGLLVIAGSALLPWNSVWPDPDIDSTIGIAVNVIVTLAWLAAAIVALIRDPRSPMWVIFFANVLADSIWLLGFLATPLAYSISDTYSVFATVLFVQALVAFPSGRLVTRFDRFVVGFTYITALVTNTLQAMTWDVEYNCDPFCNQNVFFVWKNDALHDGIRAFDAVLVPVFGLVVVWSVIRHWRAALPAARRVLLPAVVALPSAYFTNVVAYGGNNLDVQWLRDLGGHPFLVLLNAIVPVGLMVGIARSRLQRGRVADLLLELGHGVPLGRLRDVLARTLGDPSLQLAFVTPDGEYVDESGRPVEIVETPSRALSRLERDGETLAVLIHDRAIDDENPGLVEAVGSAARLALDNERLAAQVRAQLEEVRASRARIAEAADDERRRVERDLHDGAQQRLVALTMRLEQARTATTGSAQLIDEATAELREAIDEVRRLARGLHPPILTEAGLAAAVESLAERAALPVVVRIPPDRYPAAVERTAYFVIAEGLTNAAKYAHAQEAVVSASATEAELTIEVADDGLGGATVEPGGGLRGLEDRVAAIGGSLELVSQGGSGTRLRATLPLAADR